MSAGQQCNVVVMEWFERLPYIWICNLTALDCTQEGDAAYHTLIEEALASKTHGVSVPDDNAAYDAEDTRLRARVSAPCEIIGVVTLYYPH